MKVARVDEMRALDRAAMDLGIFEDLLMENAGYAVYEVIRDNFGIAGKRFLVVSGVGNNGGDGLVVARKLYSMGGEVKVFVLGDPSRFKGPSRKNYEAALKIGLDVKVLEDLETFRRELSQCHAVVDAIFGTGLTREVGGIHKEVIEAINASEKTVFSVDIPSGISGDTGAVMGIAVRADYTVTFGLPKVGNLLYPGYELCGRLYVSHISFPRYIYRDLKIETNDPIPLPPRRRDGHKGTFGRVLFVAGSKRYMGAPLLSSLSFLKAGGGLSYLATPESVSPFIATRACEVVLLPQKETPSGSISLKALDDLLDFSKDVDLVVVGPGLSLDEETKELARRLISSLENPVLIDGDGITAVSEDLSVLKARRHPTAFTPHPGEMARLIGGSVQDVVKDRLGRLEKFVSETGSYVVLKGAHSLVAFPDGRIFINPTGNPGMATAGSGDVLTGAVAAMFCLGLEFGEALRMGVFIHGFSGDLAAEVGGEDGITAVDIMEFLPEAMRMVREEFEEVLDRSSMFEVV